MAVTVRRARADDLAAIRAVGLGTWPSTYAFAGPDYVADGLARWWSEDAVRRSLALTHTLVAEEPDQSDAVIGMCALDLRPEVPVIWKLYVLPGHQGRGAGGALLDAAVAAVPSDRRAVAIEWLDGNERAATVYAARGFIETRREPDDVDPTWPDTIWAERPLP